MLDFAIPAYRLNVGVGRQFCAKLNQHLPEPDFQIGSSAVVPYDPIGPPGLFSLRKLSALPAFESDLPPGFRPATTQGFVGDDCNRYVETVSHLPLEKQRYFDDRHLTVCGKCGKPLRDLALDQRMDLLLKPGELSRIREDALTDCGSIHDAVGFNVFTPALSEHRGHRLAVKQVVNNPVRRDCGGTEAPEDFERDRLAGSHAAGQPDR